MNKIMKLTQSITFDSAHRLYGYQGNCSQLHGHTWHVSIEIGSDRPMDSCGMLLDYRVIKQHFKDYYDHHVILNMDDPLVDVIKNYNSAITVMNGNPTAENLAKRILAEIVLLADLDNINRNDWATVVVCESTDNSAEVSL